MQITAVVDGKRYTWSTQDHYPLKMTAFVWAEDAEPIWMLTGKLLAEAKPGSRTEIDVRKNLYVMYPRQMTHLPDWLLTEQLSDLEDEDTHIWAEVKFEKAAHLDLHDQDQPLILLDDCGTWKLIVEDDSFRLTRVRQWQSALVDCGFGRIAMGIRASAFKQP